MARGGARRGGAVGVDGELWAGGVGGGQVLPAQILRVTASPYPGNPYRWHTVVETPEYYQMATVDTLRSTVATDPEQDLFYKPPTTLATLAAKRSWLGEVYLDWSSWPVVTEMGPAAAIGAPAGTADWNRGAVYGPAVPVRHADDAGAQRAAALGDGVCGCGPEGRADGAVRARAAVGQHCATVAMAAVCGGCGGAGRAAAAWGRRRRRQAAAWSGRAGRRAGDSVRPGSRGRRPGRR